MSFYPQKHHRVQERARWHKKIYEYSARPYIIKYFLNVITTRKCFALVIWCILIRCGVPWRLDVFRIKYTSIACIDTSIRDTTQNHITIRPGCCCSEIFISHCFRYVSDENHGHFSTCRLCSRRINVFYAFYLPTFLLPSRSRDTYLFISNSCALVSLVYTYIRTKQYCISTRVHI